MGEVYRARDTRLSRDVAIKVLPAELASDAGRLKRFEKEARAASALNHPNIVTIHDIGTSESCSYIAMELVAGKTLRELLFAGPLPVKRLLQIAAQIAEGLAKAHEAGIVHRDLKPENVMVTRDGLVKILDFGLAKLAHTGTESGAGTNLPTESGTGAGVVLGTVGYMSPEQAGGEPVDFRSDQFSFGSILYEMATGKRAFQKKTGVDTLAAILNDEPQPLADLNPQAPVPLRWIVERCLAKAPEERFGATRDLAHDLATLRDHLTEAVGVRATPVAASRSRVDKAPRPARRGGSRRARALVPVGLEGCAQRYLAGPGVVPAAHLPPGQYHARPSCAGWADDRLQRRLGRQASRALLREDGQRRVPSARHPERGHSFHLFEGRACDPHQEGIFRVPVGGGTLARVPLGGGAPREIAEDALSADWSPDGSELALIPSPSGGKSRLEYPIGKTLYETTGGLGDDMRVSPKGDLVATLESDTNGGFVVVADRGGKARRLSGPWPLVGSPVWRPDGRSLVFNAVSSARLWSIREVSLAGKERVLYAPGQGSHSARSPARRRAAGRARNSPTRNRDVPPGRGARTRCVVAGGLPSPPSLGRRVDACFHGDPEGGGPKGGVFLRKIGAESAIRLGDGFGESLSPDGKWVLSLVPGPPQALVLLATGAGAARTDRAPGPDDLERRDPAGWTHASRRGFRARQADRPLGSPSRRGQAAPVLPEEATGGLAPSPDGKKLALHMGGGQGFILPLDGGPRTPLKGLEPEDRLDQWSGDGRYLFVSRPRELPGKVFRIEIETGRRELWKDLMPPDPAGVITCELTDDRDLA